MPPTTFARNAGPVLEYGVTGLSWRAAQDLYGTLTKVPVICVMPDNDIVMCRHNSLLKVPSSAARQPTTDLALPTSTAAGSVLELAERRASANAPLPTNDPTDEPGPRTAGADEQSREEWLAMHDAVEPAWGSDVVYFFKVDVSDRRAQPGLSHASSGDDLALAGDGLPVVPVAADGWDQESDSEDVPAAG